MKRLLNYLPLHFVVLIILGICLQFYTNFCSISISTSLLFLSCLSVFFLLIKIKSIRTFVAFFIFFFIGVSAVIINDSRNYKSFYENHLNGNSKLVLKIHKILKPGNFYHKYEAKIILVDSIKTSGTILLNIKKGILIPL